MFKKKAYGLALTHKDVDCRRVDPVCLAHCVSPTRSSCCTRLAR